MCVLSVICDCKHQVIMYHITWWHIIPYNIWHIIWQDTTESWMNPTCVGRLMSPEGHRSWLTHSGRDKMAALFHTTFSKCIFLNENVWILIRISLKFVSKVPIKDRAHLSTFKIFIFEKLSCFIVLVVFLVIVQSSELISVWFCEKMTFFPNFFSYHIFAIYVGVASLGLPTTCRIIAVSGARLPSVDGLVVRCIKMHHHVKSAITICLQFI